MKPSSPISKEKKKEECRGGRSILGQDSVLGFGFRSRNGATVRERKEIQAGPAGVKSQAFRII